MTQETDTQDPARPGDDLDFSAIERKADALEGAADAAALPPPPPPTTTAAELEGTLQIVRAMAAPVFHDWQQFGQVWSDQALNGIAVAGGAVMDRHGWTMGEFMAQWGPYIALVAAVAPPSLATFAHIKQRKADAERRQQQGAANGSHQQATD